MRHMRVLLLVVWIVGSGCSTSSDPAPKTPDEFELTEWPTLDDGSLYPDYPVATPSVVTPERIEYEAGQLLWARPDHRVVFHRAAEIATYSPEHPGYPDFYIDQRAANGPPNAIGEYVPSYLWFPALTSLGKSRRDIVAWEPVSYPGSRAFRSTSSRRSHYAGIYRDGFFSEIGVQDPAPTLHLFECRVRSGEVRLFQFGDAWVFCTVIHGLQIYFRQDTPLHDRYSCFLHSMVDAVAALKENPPEFTPESIQNRLSCPVEMQGAIEPRLEAEIVSWVGFGDPASGGHHHGYSYTTHVRDFPRTHRARHPLHPDEPTVHEFAGVQYADAFEGCTLCF